MTGNGGWGYTGRAAAFDGGHLPPDILERARRQTAEGRPWITNLSARGLWLLRQMGLVPIGNAMGSAVFHTNLETWIRWYGAGGSWSPQSWVSPLTELEGILRTARLNALARLEEEAAAMGALAVVGLSLRQTMPGFYLQGGEVAALGTAVGAEGGPAPDRSPLICPLPVADLARLLGSGIRPRGAVVGVAVQYLASGWGQQAAMQSWTNQELTDLSRALSLSRERAVDDLRHQARELGADGVLVDSITDRVHPLDIDSGGGTRRTDFVIELVALGTAVNRGPAVALPRMRPVLRLN